MDTEIPTTNEQLAITMPYPCTRCEKSFKSAQALACHKMRVHTRAGKLGARKGGQVAASFRAKSHSEVMKAVWARKKSRPSWKSESPTYKQMQYRKYRDRNLAKGLTAQGKVRKQHSPLSLALKNGHTPPAQTEPEKPQLDFHAAADQIVAAARILTYVAMSERM